jgi:membrane peptidoglycan carboxypeptidase
MKLVNNNAFKMLKVVFARALAATGIVLALAAILVVKKHREAEAFLDHIDLQARNTSGATFYAAKKRLFVGESLAIAGLIEYLRSVNFVQSDQQDRPGSYYRRGRDTLVITPGLAEFQPVTVRFKHNRIAVIEVSATPLNATSGNVSETTIEPEPIGAFITSINGDDASRMFVRRYALQFDDFAGSDLFFAILASEDSTFLSHGGTRFERILMNLLGRQKGGASSITAQVIKNAISLDRTHSVMRKLDELFLASALEHRTSKEDILTLYVNHVFLGGGKGSANLYGFRAAAEEYFGKKNIRDLTLNETCILVAMLTQPNDRLDEVKRGDYSQLRKLRDRVLDRLHKCWPDRYPTAVIEAVKLEPVNFVPSRDTEQPMDTLCRGFIGYATQRQPLIDLVNLPPTDYSGLHIYTSVDPDLMRSAQRILTDRLPAIERRFPPVQLGGCAGRSDRLLGAIIALDPKTGEIITMSGGAGGRDGVQYSRFALNALGSPASVIKLFWAVKALAEASLPNGERYTAASNLNPTGASLNGWQPSLGLAGSGRPRVKLAISADDFAVYTLNLIDAENGRNFYHAVTGNTITSVSGQWAVGFGAGTELSPLRMARACTIFGNNGRLTEPNAIGEVFLDGKAIDFRRRPANQVIEPGASYITTQMMRSVLGYGPDGVRGTARQAFARTGLSLDDIEMGAKTGSGPDSVWMISVSPKLVTVVMLAYQCHSQIKNSQEMYSRDTAALIWAEFIRSVRRFRPDLLTGKFDIPSNIVTVNIDPITGCRSEGPRTIKEFFIEGTEPAPCR